MKIREIILRITRILLIFMIMALIMLVLAYREDSKHKYTYVVDEEFYKSFECYIDKLDNRICRTEDGKEIPVEYYYEEEE